MKIKTLIFNENQEKALLFPKSEIVRYIKDWIYNYKDEDIPNSSLQDCVFTIGFKNSKHHTFSIYNEIIKIDFNNIAWIIWNDSDNTLVYLNKKYQDNFINFVGDCSINKNN